MQVERGTMSPEQIAKYGEHQEREIYHQSQADRLEAQRVSDEREANIRRLEQEERERADMAEIRKRTMDRNKSIAEQRDKIMQDVANAPVREPGLWANKNFGESLLTGLSVLAVGMGVGAMGGKPEGIIGFVNQLANREVENQRRINEQKVGKADALDTIYGKNMAALGDETLAHQATLADILQKSVLELEKKASDTANAQLSQSLMAAREAMQAKAIESRATLEKNVGDKIAEGVARDYIQERRQREKEETVAKAEAQFEQDVAQKGDDPDERKEREREITEAVQSGDARRLRAVIQKTFASKGQPKRAPAGRAEPKKRESWADEAVNRLNAGDPSFVDVIPDVKIKEYVAKAEKLQKAYSVEGARINTEEALAMALRADMGIPIPEQYMPASKRELAVRTGGRAYFADSPMEAKAQSAANDMDDQLIHLGTKIISTAEEAGARWSPETKAKITALSTELLPTFSVAKGQGAMAEGEIDLYSKISGGSLRDYVGEVTEDAVTRVREMVRSAIARKRARLGRLSTDWFGDVGAKPFRKVN
jgi:hypothetical protein